MPGGDRTGPAGMGPMTGRGAGYCAGYATPGYMNPYGGRYFGAGRGAFGGRGRGRGYRNQYYATGQPGWSRYNMGMPVWDVAGEVPYYGDPYYPPDVDPKEETKILKDQADMLKKQLDSIQARVDEIQKESKKKKE